LAHDCAVSGLIAAAARNNAEWCSIICRHHGIESVMAADAWTAQRRTPDGYPDADVLAADVNVDSLLARIDTGPGCSVKDSFATIDLAPYGFRVLFEAFWIWRPASPVRADLPRGWMPVRTPRDLDMWSTGRTPGVFRTALLDEPDVRLFHRPMPAGGFALSGHAGVVGVSNVLCEPQARAAVWDAIIATASTTYPGRDLVGYESGDDLDAAVAAGFSCLGPLRVWMR
jgi:hypothetical protein